MVDISEEKAHLSKLMDRVCRGEKVVIAKNGLPIADLVPHRPDGIRKLGFLKGRLDMPDQVILETDEEIENMFYGDDDRKSQSILMSSFWLSIRLNDCPRMTDDQRFHCCNCGLTSRTYPSACTPLAPLLAPLDDPLRRSPLPQNC